jgi:hypothetical protein
MTAMSCHDRTVGHFHLLGTGSPEHLGSHSEVKGSHVPPGSYRRNKGLTEYSLRVLWEYCELWVSVLHLWLWCVERPRNVQQRPAQLSPVYFPGQQWPPALSPLLRKSAQGQRQWPWAEPTVPLLSSRQVRDKNGEETLLFPRCWRFTRRVFCFLPECPWVEPERVLTPQWRTRVAAGSFIKTGPEFCPSSLSSGRCSVRVLALSFWQVHIDLSLENGQQHLRNASLRIPRSPDLAVSPSLLSLQGLP